MAWKPTDEALFIAERTQFEDRVLALRHGGTYSQVRKYIDKLRKDGTIADHKRTAKTLDYASLFLAFLCKSRSKADITKKFPGQDIEALLAAEYEGYALFTQLNDYHQAVYILLPVFDKTIEVLPRDWKVYTPLSEVGHGVPQPYCLVNLPDGVFDRCQDDDESMGRIDIAPLFDVHLGNYGHRLEKFQSYIRWIAEAPNVYAVCGGDLMENALDDGRGMSYDQDINPQNQMDEMTCMLAPIAHKILCMIPGNHERRTYAKSGIDPMRVIAERLNIPYFDGPVYLSIIAGVHRFKMYIQHGYGNSQTKGGKLNSAGRPRKFTDFVHFFLSGHVHDPVVNSETCIVEDPENCRLVYKQQWTVIAPSFLRFEGTYAYRAGYAPPGSGGVAIHLYENGTYRATLK